MKVECDGHVDNRIQYISAMMMGMQGITERKKIDLSPGFIVAQLYSIVLCMESKKHTYLQYISTVLYQLCVYLC